LSVLVEYGELGSQEEDRGKEREEELT
jgi:hypothetical protein